MGTITAELVETGEKRDTMGRRVTPAERRTALVEAFHQSGLTMAEMARREGIRYSTFAGWVLRSKKPGAKPRKVLRFAEVKLPTSMAAPLEVRLADGTVVRGSDAAGVAALVRALRA